MIKRKTNENGFLGGAIALTVSVLIVKIIGYVYKLPLSRILGDEGMGYFNSAYSIFGFFYMLSMGGVPRAVAICVTEARVKNGSGEAKRILNISLRMFLSIGTLFSVLLMTCSGWFAKVIGNSMAKLSMLCIAPSLTFVSAAGVLRGYLNGVGKINAIAVAEIIDGVSKFITGLTFALIAVRKNAAAPIISAYTVLGVSIGSFLGSLYMLVSAKIYKTQENTEQNTEQKTKTEQTKNEILKKIFKISVPITLSSAVMGATNIIDLGLIMQRLKSIGFDEVEAIAMYGNFTTLVIPLLNLVSAFITPLATASMAHVTRLKALGRKSEYYELLKQILSLTSIATLPVMFAYSFFSEDILLLLFESSSARLAAPLLVFAAPSVFFSSMLIMCNTVLEASGYAHVPVISMGIGATVKIVSAYFLVGHFGISGAPISTSLCYFVSFIISMSIMKRRLHFKASLIKTVSLPFVFSFALIFVGSVFYNSFTSNSSDGLKFIAFSILIALFYVAVMLVFMRKKVKILTNYVKSTKKEPTAL